MSYIRPEWTNESLAKADFILLNETIWNMPSTAASMWRTWKVLKEELSQFLDEASPQERESILGETVRKNQGRDLVVQLVEEAGFDDFGFMVFRLDYGDEEEWLRWKSKFLTHLDLSLAMLDSSERIEDNLLTNLVEDEELDTAGFCGAAWYYIDLQEEGLVQPGLDLSMFLAVDKNAMDSLLLPEAGQEPWVWAVDRMSSFEVGQQPPQGDPPLTLEYPGYFRIAVSELVPQLWPICVLLGEMCGTQMWDMFTSVRFDLQAPSELFSLV